MASKADKDRRKALRDEVKRSEQIHAESKLPLSKLELKQLFDWVDTKLTEEGCDHTLRHSMSFLKQHGKPHEPVTVWLKAEGGYCDCEVIANVEGSWQGIING